MSGFLEQRLKQCQKLMAEKGLEALLVTHLTNIYYLTGFSGDCSYCFNNIQSSYFHHRLTLYLDC